MNFQPRLSVLVAFAFLAGCVGQSIPLPQVGQHTGATGHLYIGTDTGTIESFALPVTAGSVALASVNSTNASGMAADATHLYVTDDGSSTGIRAFNLPLTTGAVPAFTIADTGAQDVKFDSSGRLIVAQDLSSTCCIQVFAPPFSAASTAAFTLNLPDAGTGDPYGVTMDPSGNIFEAGTNTNAKFTGPLTAASTAAATFGPNYDNYGIASDSTGRIFVANGTANGELDVYAPPITAGSTRAFGLSIGSTNYVGYPAFDSAGNLYVPIPTDNKVYVFAPPITAASTPAFSMTISHAYGAIAGP